MRVLVDATIVASGRLTGCERYAENLVDALAEHDDLDLHVAVRAGICPGPWQAHPDLALHEVHGPGRLGRDQFALPKLVRQLRPDVVHHASLALPLVKVRPKSLVTVHDAVLWRYPETLSVGSRWYYGPVLKRALRRAGVSGVLTVSNAAAMDLADVVPEEVPIFVARNGFAQSLQGARPETSAGGSFLLTVATQEPRKNIDLLWRALALLEQRGELRAEVRVVGRQGWGPTGAPPASVAKHVRLLGPVSDEALAALYRDCLAVVLPSIYEGFGLPLLEAMALGAPAVVSDIAAFREIGGDAGIFFDPRDPASLAVAISTVVGSEALREELRRRGTRQAREFTWKRCAAETLDAYRRLSGEIAPKAATA